ncbi:MAG: glycosyltransferase, partial [Gammaproteobacteria bacterium]|nr:glycosyltransferase [Gammaproteobacteria bacterium]
MNKLDSFISVVSLLEPDPSSVQFYLTELQSHLENNFTDYEIIVIDRGSSEAASAHLEQLLHSIPSIRQLKLAFYVDDDVAFAAGMENAIGDFVILHSSSRDPVNCIRPLVDASIEGKDIIIGSARQHQTPGYKLLRPFIQWVLNRIGYNLPRNATGLRCLSRRVVNAITRSGRFHHQLYVRINKTGYPYSTYHYSINDNYKSRRTLRNGLSQGSHLLVFNSTKPLRWMSGLGLLGSLAALSFSLYSLAVHYFKDNVIEGWTTMIFFTSFLFAIMFAILAFFGEYLGRLLDERHDQSD